MIRLNDITSQILSYHPKADLELVEKAYVYSAKVHKGQLRLSGEPYLSHCLETAHILARMRLDVTCIVAGLLHDALEDSNAEPEEISQLFGESTRNLVEGVTKISKIEFSSQKRRQAENIRKMILAMSSDIRVILIKLADRLHNMRTLGYQPPEKQRQIASETLEIYAPLAGRIGIYWMKSEMEDLCLYYLEPEIYERIQWAVAQRRDEREKFIKETKKAITEKLEEVGIQANVKGRNKHYYGIYKKMLQQDVNIDQIYDVVGFRVIVSTIKECYSALGHIHSMWKQVQGRFKDYISVPKANMYQSIHTTVLGAAGEKMEVQIRTRDMDLIAEEGIAAHWKYKEGAIPNSAEDQQFAWLRQLAEWQQSLKDPDEFLETVRMNLFPDEVYVFTPRGEVKAFPKGATPVDFAYSIHSEVGEKCMGAKVNGKMVPLKQELKNGDIVEIITSTNHHPSRNWLEFVKTPRAKNKIRQWLKNQEREESVSLGRSILERALEQEKITLPTIMKSEQLEAIAKELSFHSIEDLIAQIGFGKISARHVIGRLRPKMGLKEPKRPQRLVGKMVSRIKRRKSDHGIKVKGVSDMLIRFASCCHPLPGEPVVGFITRGKGLTIHNRDCRHIMSADPERVVDVSWEPPEDELYLARLRITSVEKKGMLANLSAVITQKDGNIVNANVKTTVDQKGIGLFTIEVSNNKQLQEIITALNKVRDVLLVEKL